MYCPNCGKQILDTDVFCAFCRQRVSVQQQAVQQSPVPPSPSGRPPAQQNPPYYAQPMQQPASAAPARNTGLIAAGVLAGIVIITAAVLLFIKPGYLRDRDDSSRDSTPAVLQSSSVPVTSTAAESFPYSGTALSDTGTPATEATLTESAPPATVTTAAPAEGRNDFGIEPPDFSDFSWCYGQYGLLRDIPEGGVQMTDLSSWKGNWKCMIIYTPQDVTETMIRELNYAEIFSLGDDPALRVQPAVYEADGVCSDRSDAPLRIYPGELYNGWLYTSAEGDGDIILYYFWQQDGHEYALGDYRIDETTEYYIALTR